MKDLRRILACIAGLWMLIPFAFARPEPNAFLNKAAPDLRSIIRQVKNDPKVLSRYQRHFGMTKWELVAYFETLKLVKLTKGGPYIVYNCRERDEKIGQKMFHLKAGTLIYVDRMGMPVLKFSCGNPMSRGPARLIAADLVMDEPILPPTDVKLPDIQGPTEPLVPEERMVVEELATPTFAPEPPIPPVLPPVTPEPPVVKPSYESPAVWLVPLISASIITNVKNNPPPSGPPTIPDPATIITLGGLCGAYMMRKRSAAAADKQPRAPLRE